jgi:hypothetical protein
MSDVFTSRCDECGKLKQEANHWFRAVKSHDPRFVIVPWEVNLDPDPDAGDESLHLCGMGCAVKAMSKAMEQSG